ncbi:DUF4224 domain-containing protein [Pseudomonas sp. zfem002]|uniref:DUF4224 domain-containing protein n=1 Tax=Pseudomonas sp. zfem002 TaxID=3078197 RepID=UPI002928DFB8|nr:DUF4224 domain-containing protein [Pseudomonas sp. zfem002]MDU9391875.1 DUF4224 domain-containing protein [Pseudomonas sp. zfem002]
METEILSDEELAELTGYKPRAWQRRWLNDRGWHYVESRGGRPLVGRQYARQKLSGAVLEIVPATPPPQPHPAWVPDFSRVK